MTGYSWQSREYILQFNDSYILLLNQFISFMCMSVYSTLAVYSHVPCLISPKQSLRQGLECVWFTGEMIPGSRNENVWKAKQGRGKSQ